MGTVWDDVLRHQLVERRERLAAAMGFSNGSERLAALLQEVDSTLERVEHGSFGLCSHCHGEIEADRLLANPLASTCLDCLSTSQKRALEHDLDLAARIQNQLLPKAGRFGAWEVRFHYQPAGAVSGDYCDVLAENGKGIMFLMGDVSGKGIAASLLMSQLHAIFRSLSPYDIGVTELVSRANRLFCENTISTHYATLVCGCACGDGEVMLCNAGHCPPLLLHRGEAVPIEPTGLPLGLFDTAQYDCRTFRLEPGDTLVFYTDGFTEAEDAEEREYGMDRLIEALGRNTSGTAGEMISAALSDLEGFRAGVPLRDDLTLMVVKRDSLN